ncbi:hypothetical protein [Luteolibacter sp. Populi]|uniref:hypothetical protein n=1 Tax=Luteolibacter sp. Populi TaxID=3230487 RepID=UPI00346501AA
MAGAINPPRDAAGDATEEVTIPDGRDICLNCMAPYGPLMDFCAGCGAPLTSFASTQPFERTLAEGYAYRQAVESPRKLIVVAGIWLIFVPMAIAGAGLLTNVRWQSFPGSPESAFAACGSLARLAVSGIIIARTTWAYYSGKSRRRESAA